MAMLRWTVQFAVDESWVADGFDLTDERAREMLNNDLSVAYTSELGAKILKAPPAVRVAKLQGYRGKQLDEGIKTVNRIREEGRLKRGD